MAGKAWQLKAVEDADTSRRFKRSKGDGSKREQIEYKRVYTRRRHGKWFAHGISVYQLWWEFLVRAYQAEGAVKGISVDRERYKEWGSADDYLNIDVWSAKSRKDGFWTFWKTYGIDLFAEDDDRGVRVVTIGNSFKADGDKFYLEIAKGTAAHEMMDAIKRIVRENVQATKTSHISTAKMTVKGNEIRTEAFRRWLKMWDMKQKKYSTDDIDAIHGVIAQGGFDDYRTTYRNLWKAKKVIKNVANGEFTF
jgi:hypothetical protein